MPAWPAVHLKTRTPQEGDLLDLSAERVRSLGGGGAKALEKTKKAEAETTLISPPLADGPGNVFLQY